MSKKIDNNYRDRLKAVESRTSYNSKEDLLGLWNEPNNHSDKDHITLLSVDHIIRFLTAKVKQASTKTSKLHKRSNTNSYLKVAHKNEPKSLKIAAFFSTLKNKLLLRKRTSIAGLIGVIMVLSVVASTTNNNKSQTDILGESTEIVSDSNPVDNPLPREVPDFKLIYPTGKDESSLDPVRISPEGAEPSYAYVDRIGDSGDEIQITQQQVPKDFDIVATTQAFQATNKIQIDETTVYHGFSEKGGVQSLIFIKDDKLVFIRSPRKLADDQWAAYILNLK